MTRHGTTTIITHRIIFCELQANVRRVTDAPETWLRMTLRRYSSAENSTMFQSLQVYPTGYTEPVGAKDAIHSVQSSLSAWLLSWLLIIFYPLSFTCSPFGMNVRTLSHHIHHEVVMRCHRAFHASLVILVLAPGFALSQGNIRSVRYGIGSYRG